MEESACKPDPVREARASPATICLAERRGVDAGPFAGPVRPTRQLGRAALERCLLGLAPGGACRAATVARRAGGLLPHRFTLTATANRNGGLLSVALPRGHPRLALASTLPWGVRTFLERCEHRPRPPGRLLRGEHTRVVAYVSVMSRVTFSEAPAGKAIVSVTVYVPAASAALVGSE
jgi:hypothetical protein